MTQSSGETPVSVIIPAHNEEQTLGRLLDGMSRFGRQAEIVVVANGCTDATAAVGSMYPWVKMIEIGTASKRAALNAGDRMAQHMARIYLDADVSVSSETLESLAREILTVDAVVASPAVQIDQAAASLPARAYQAIWALTDYRRESHTGSGIFGLSPAGRARFDVFPDVIADDLYVRMLFGPGERHVSPGAPFVIYAPRTLRAQVHRLRRTMAGEMQLSQAFPSLERATGARRHLIRRVARRPLLWPALVVYSLTYVIARRRARAKLAAGDTFVWERDLTTR